METEENERYMPRKFGFTHILWNIENSFFVSYRRRWEIYSPAFNVNGSYVTTWRFILKASKCEDDGSYVASMHLERLQSDGVTGPVRVSWKLWHPLPSFNYIICEREHIFVKETSMGVPIKDFRDLEEWLQLISSCKFCIEGVILVTTKEDTETFQRSEDIGLKTLSQELRALFNLEKYHDLIINFGEMSLKCHKAILSVRNKKLQDAIDEDSGESEIILDWRGNESIRKIFSYLYSGNLEHVLRLPSTCIDEDIDYFGIKALEAYYQKDELTLSTRFEGREIYFKWVIMDINSESGNILSPNFRNGKLNITFRIRLEVNAEFVQSGERGQNEDIATFLEIVEGSVPEELYIKYDILDIAGNSVRMNAMQWSSREGGNLGIQNFVSRTILNDPSIVCDGVLCIRCTLFIPTGESHLCVDNSRLCLLTSLNHEEHYLLLSKQIAKLFETGKYFDLKLRCKETRFKVHKCILSARSYIFAEAIRRLGEKRKGFSITKCEPNIIRILLDYVYSGILRNHELSDVLKIYSAGDRFGLKSLTNQCSEILQDNFQTLNVLDVLPIANTCKDLKLMISSFNFIMRNSKDLCRQEKWEKLMENSSLYKELQDYVRNYIRSKPGADLELDEDFKTALNLNKFCQDEPVQH